MNEFISNVTFGPVPRHRAERDEVAIAYYWGRHRLCFCIPEVRLDCDYCY